MHSHQFTYPLVHLSQFLPYTFLEWSRVSGSTQMFIHLISATGLGFKKFLCSSLVIIYHFFFHLCYLVYVRFLYPSTCNFPFLQVLGCFPDFAILFLPLVFYSLFTSSCHVFQSQIPFRYLGCISNCSLLVGFSD